MTDRIDWKDIKEIQRQRPTRQIPTWPEWIEWIVDYYGTTQTELAKQTNVSRTYISAIKHGSMPGEELKLCLASYAVDGGPLPPSFEISDILYDKMKEYLREHRDD